MKSVTMLVLVLLGSCLLSVKGGDASSRQKEKVERLVNSEDCLRREIERIVALLEQNDVKSSEKVFYEYALPEDIEAFKENGNIKELAEHFHKNKRLVIIRALKATMKLKPEVKDRTNYTFTIPKDLKVGESIVFVWSEKDQRFYVCN